MIFFFKSLVLAVTLLSLQKNGVELTVEAKTAAIDPAYSVNVDMTLKSPSGMKVIPPDLRTRVRGFSRVEDFLAAPDIQADGGCIQKLSLNLVPEPCAEEYKIAPFAVTVEGSNDLSFVAGPVYFENPAARETVTGGFEVDPKKVLPPFSWRLAGLVALILLVVVLIGAALFVAVRLLVRRAKERRMSPIERAWVELDRLLKRQLPAHGRYKDFYVELTMVVRRYVQRKYGIRAPNLTTEEFFHELRAAKLSTQLPSMEDLGRFLESADMVKFAGVEATPEMAADATESARGYLRTDSSNLKA